MAIEDIYRQEWSPGIGDPTITGWFTVAAYLIAAVFALGRMRADADDELCCHRMWMLLAIVMFFLAINKQLDLQTWLTLTLKEHALINGWYQDRRSYQSMFIITLGLIGVVTSGIFLYLVRERWKDFTVAAFGLAFLLLFVLSRASSFHQIDTLINTEAAGFRLNWLFELTGIFLVAYGVRYRHDKTEFEDQY